MNEWRTIQTKINWEIFRSKMCIKKAMAFNYTNWDPIKLIHSVNRRLKRLRDLASFKTFLSFKVIAFSRNRVLLNILILLLLLSTCGVNAAYFCRLMLDWTLLKLLSVFLISCEFLLSVDWTLVKLKKFFLIHLKIDTEMKKKTKEGRKKNHLWDR